MRLPKLPLFILLAVIWTVVSAAGAAAQKVEITPFGGFRFGGDARDDDARPPLDFELDESDSFGVIVDVALGESLWLELGWSRQETVLFEDFGIFDREALFDIELDVIQIGLLYEWGPGQLRPFFAFGLGATELNPLVPGIGSATRLSGSVGGGAKLMFTRHLGLRFEGRVISTLLEDDEDRDFCCRRGFHDEDDVLTQGEARLGLVLAF